MQALILGNWKSPCISGTPKSRVIELSISQFSIVSTQHEYKDSQCSQFSGDLSQHLPYKVVSVNKEGNRLEIAIIQRSAALMPNDPNLTAGYAKGKACGRDDWKPGQENNVSLSNCGDRILDTANYGNWESISINASGQLTLGNSPAVFTRQLIQLSKQALALADNTEPVDYGFPSNLQEIYHRDVVSPLVEDKGLNLAGTAESFGPCPGDPSRACGNFSEALRRACMACGGGPDTCAKGVAWSMAFAKSLSEMLKTISPEMACKVNSNATTAKTLISGTAARQQRSSKELPSQVAQNAQAQTQELNNALMESESQNLGANPESKSSASLGGAAPSRKQTAKELAAHVLGLVATTPVYGMSFFGCGPICGQLAAIALTPAATHVAGQILDKFLPTPQKSAQ